MLQNLFVFPVFHNERRPYWDFHYLVDLHVVILLENIQLKNILASLLTYKDVIFFQAWDYKSNIVNSCAICKCIKGENLMVQAYCNIINSVV